MKIVKKDNGCCASSCDCETATKPQALPDMNRFYISGAINSKIGQIPRTPSTLSARDKWENFKVRCAIGRMKYTVEPGLYGVGDPDAASMVLVTANYKLSFDALRKELQGINAWILVLDTKGINVWCAAGKGTFGTAELVHRIEVSGLKEIVSHKKLIVPQLGAVGISAHHVKQQSGFSVIYGPVRAADLPVFLESGLKTTAPMRRVGFTMIDRLKVIPVELVMGFRALVYIALVFFLISGFTAKGDIFTWRAGVLPILYLVAAYLAGVVLGPLLLPWLPGRSFAVKGAFAGLIAFAGVYFTTLSASNTFEIFAWMLLITSLSSFLTLNFTGASTYTSLSGVKKEMRLAIPSQSMAAVLGAILWIGVRIHII